jgi:hypothetical protein
MEITPAQLAPLCSLLTARFALVIRHRSLLAAAYDNSVRSSALFEKHRIYFRLQQQRPLTTVAAYISVTAIRYTSRLTCLTCLT